MTIQEIILNQLPQAKANELISSQLAEANDILSRENLKIKNYTLDAIPLQDIIPSQSGDDYENSSSKYDAETFKAVIKGNKSIDAIRLQSFRPLAVNKHDLVIIDGNHRHYALKEIGEKFAFTLLCETEHL